MGSAPTRRDQMDDGPMRAPGVSAAKAPDTICGSGKHGADGVR